VKFTRFDLHPPSQRWRDRRDGDVYLTFHRETAGWYVSVVLWKRSYNLTSSRETT
jgi:hypothetical protein